MTQSTRILAGHYLTGGTWNKWWFLVLEWPMKFSPHAPRIAPSIAAGRVPIASDLGPARW